MSSKTKDIKIEENLERLDEILKKMEEPDVELSKSFTLYEEGIGLLKRVNEEIEDMKGKVEILSKEGVIAEFDSDLEDE